MKYQRPTNIEISENYRDQIFWLFATDLTAALAYYIVRQLQFPATPTLINDIKIQSVITLPVMAYSKHIDAYFPSHEIPTSFNYGILYRMINEEVFESISEIAMLGDSPFNLDIAALASNVFFMVLREQITSGYFENSNTQNKAE